MDPYSDRKRDALARLTRLLNPQGPREQRLVDWLGGWDIETIDGLADMVERERQEPQLRATPKRSAAS